MKICSAKSLSLVIVSMFVLTGFFFPKTSYAEESLSQVTYDISALKNTALPLSLRKEESPLDYDNLPVFWGTHEHKILLAWFEESQLWYSLLDQELSTFSTPEALLELFVKEEAEQIADLKINGDQIDLLMSSEQAIKHLLFENNFLKQTRSFFTDETLVTQACILESNLIALLQDETLNLYSNEFNHLASVPLHLSPRLLDSQILGDAIIIFYETESETEAINYVFCSLEEENVQYMTAALPKTRVSVPIQISEETVSIHEFSYQAPVIDLALHGALAPHATFNTPHISFEVENLSTLPVKTTVYLNQLSKVGSAEIILSQFIEGPNQRVQFELADLAENQDYSVKIHSSNGFNEHIYPTTFVFNIDTTAPSLASISKLALRAGENTIRLAFNEDLSEYCAPRLLLDDEEYYLTSKLIEEKVITLSFDIFDAVQEGLHAFEIEGISDQFHNVNENLKFSVFVDKTAPEITFLFPDNPTTTVATNAALVSGLINETTASLIINDTILPIDNDGAFETVLFFNQGTNEVLALATDEAGNDVTHQFTINYIPVEPILTLLSPSSESFVNAGQIFLVELEVYDYQEDIIDETEIKITCQSLNEIEGSVFYDAETKKASGFIFIPEEVVVTSLNLGLALCDADGNLGQTDLLLNLDTEPPTVDDLRIENQGYSSKRDNITINVSDQGAGVDAEGSLVQVQNNQISLEGEVTLLNEQLCFAPDYLLEEGTYEVIVTLRDLAGNLSPEYKFDLWVDLSPPQVEIETPLKDTTANDKYNLCFDVSAPDLADVKIRNNNKLQTTLLPNPNDSNYYTKVITLTKGTNFIEVVATDYAGNSSVDSISLFANIYEVGASAISDLSYGPNPFDPETETHYIIFNLSQTTDVILYIFNQAGELIYKNTYANSSGSTQLTWNGSNQFGQKVPNGVYSYILRTVGVGSSTEKGKIMVLR